MKVAITGGIAEGKSTVLEIIHSLGHSVASADEIARHIFLREDVQARIALFSGLQSPFARDDLRKALSESDDLRRHVNSVMHPLITKEMLGGEAYFVEVPLLVETCLQGDFSEVWVVSCGLAEQRRRMVARYGNEAHAIALLSTQLPAKVKIAFADRVIRTNRPVSNVRRVVSEAVQQVLG